MRILLSALAGAFVTFFLGAIEFVVLLSGYFDAHFGHIARPPADIDARVWAIALEKLVQALALAFIYRRWARSDRAPALEGARFGALAALLIAVPWGLSMWTNYRLEFVPVAVFALADLVRFPIAGAVIGLVQGKRLGFAAPISAVVARPSREALL
jgi:hypothetical protein